MSKNLFVEVTSGNLIVAVTDELPSLPRGVKKILQGHKVIDNRFPCFSALLHGRNDSFLDTVTAHGPAFGILAFEERKFVDTNLCSLFSHPFHAFHHLCRSDGDVYGNRELWCRAGVRLSDAIFTFFVGRQCHLCLMNAPQTIDEEDGVPLFKSEHTNGMSCLLLWQGTMLCCLWYVEKTFFFHENQKKHTPIKAYASLMFFL